jgi:hypothetical protein
MSGGKGGSQTTKTKIDPKLEQGAIGTLAGALKAASLDYSPNRGITIAGLSPQEQAANQGANMAAGAFGLPMAQMGGYLPEVEQGAGGVSGYSTGALYDQNVGKSVTKKQQQERANILKGYGQIAGEINPIFASGGAGKGGGGSKKASTPMTFYEQLMAKQNVGR